MPDQKYSLGILKAQERHALQAAAGSTGQTPVKAEAHSLRFPNTKKKRKRVQIHQSWVTTKACASLVHDVSSAPWPGALMVEQDPHSHSQAKPCIGFQCFESPPALNYRRLDCGYRV